MRIEDLIAGFLFLCASSIVMIPLFMISLSMKDPFPYPFGDPVAIGGIMLIICIPLLAASRYNNFRNHVKEVRKLTIIGIIISIALFIFMTIPFSFSYLLAFSITLLALTLIEFVLMPPQYFKAKLTTES
jgi:chromate transport protein ChrA